jgi:AraC family transcriptional regulator
LKWYFSLVDEAQQLRRVVLELLDQEQNGKGLARHAYRSRTQFYRLFRAMIEETPVAMRRRLLLERAAWQLSRTQLSVTEISLNANYGSLEAFTRAFRKAFHVSPSLYRRIGATYTHLHATNRIHYHSGNDTKGAGQSMDLFDIFSGQESWHTRRLLELAKTLNDEQVDCPLENQVKVFPWDEPDQSLRQILERMVQTKEVWAVALTGGSIPPWTILRRRTELLPPCWHVSTERTPRSMACLPKCATEVLGTTRLSMRCASRRRPSPLAACSLT